MYDLVRTMCVIVYLSNLSRMNGAFVKLPKGQDVKNKWCSCLIVPNVWNKLRICLIVQYV